MKLAITSCLFILQLLSLNAQPDFNSEKLKEIFYLLSEGCKNKINQKIEFIPCDINGNSIKIRCCYKGNTINHIGLNIFKKEEILFYPKEVFLFIEKSLLEYILVSDYKEINKRNAEDNIKLLFNGTDISYNTFSIRSNILQILNDESTKILTKDSLIYLFKMESYKDELVLKFPARNTLIRYMDKKELDIDFATNLKTFTTTQKLLPQIELELVKQFDKNIFVSSGEVLHDGISSNLFLRKVDTTFNLVYDKKYYVESFSNQLLMGSKDDNKKLNIKHKVYGNEKEEYVVKLNDFLDFFYSQNDYKLFVGIENSEKENMQATLVIYNKNLSFINLLFIDTNFDNVFDQNSTYNCKFYSNIPTDNIKDLYGVYNDKVTDVFNK